jgi:hypothetical protein
LLRFGYAFKGVLIYGASSEHVVLTGLSLLQAAMMFGFTLLFCLRPCAA